MQVSIAADGADASQLAFTPFRDERSVAHLRRLEAESIFILREVVAECRAPVMLYSVGKDSTVMLHLARKAFFPGKPPFPLLHIDTTWKFREMIAFRDSTAARLGLDLITHTNEQARLRGVNPFDHGGYYTHAMKTEALLAALKQHGFDAAFGGARRDEEKSRAKERVFSFRTADQHWDPKNQRPEFGNIYNARVNRGESIRVFPLSNWTELDVWHYIMQEDLDIAPLYFAADRPTVERDGTLLVVDEPERMRWRPDERAVPRRVRFRSLGCWPLTGAMDSAAATVPEIVAEMFTTRGSERASRLIDRDENDSMEKKKREGYF